MKTKSNTATPIAAENIDDLAHLPKLKVQMRNAQDDNNARASFAAAALVAYANRVGGNDCFGIQIGDLLADFMHLSDALGISFDEELHRAQGNYAAEVAGA